MEEGAADDGAAADEDAGVLVVLEPPQAVSPRRAAAVRPTKARAGRFVDNMSFSLFLEPGRWIHSVVGHGRPGVASAPPVVCVSPAIRRVGLGGWVGIEKVFLSVPARSATAWLRTQRSTPVPPQARRLRTAAGSGCVELAWLLRKQLLEFSADESWEEDWIRVSSGSSCILRLLPLVVALGRQDGSALDCGRAEGRLLQDALAASIDQLGAELGVLGPGWDQAPPAISRRRSMVPSSRHSATMGTFWVGASFQLGPAGCLRSPWPRSGLEGRWLLWTSRICRTCAYSCHKTVTRNPDGTGPCRVLPRAKAEPPDAALR